ncbi:trehalose-phosphatase [Mycobacterium sp. ITM-2016-00316]|uniref:trehalose-phosphatase n=1 Tax=Mycobacterium sp. ITM-2016-00316 TaxID=2099695 RepID=UPI00287F82A4|nr:trehalose-phosphatase [Mycobacterium sp. ITM-2016-00316]WNG79852.1 trehalose-phosphatase [Mycobacterium sp. ITM-2016-00316]
MPSNSPTQGKAALTLPVTIDPRYHDAVIFDLDGVITDTASIHAAAWATMFDDFLARRPERAGEDHSRFTDYDYRHFVDGKPRYSGVTDFLTSRGISLPQGLSTDVLDDSVCGLGNRKQRLFLEQLALGVPVFHSTVALVRTLQAVGVATAVFSSSRNCENVLRAAGIGDLFGVRIDGVVADELGLPGKPDPAVLLEAARRLAARPERAVVVEDADAGVSAGRRGGFTLVIGVDRTGHADELLSCGADVVVTDLADVAVRTGDVRISRIPSALDSFELIAALVATRRPAVFVDYDGTLSAIVPDPCAATLVDGAADTLERLAKLCSVAVISGRDLADIEARVGLPAVWYAGSHGFELTRADGSYHQNETAAAATPLLERTATQLREAMQQIPGARVEHKRFAIAVHFRNVAPERVGEVVAAAHRLGQEFGLRVTNGRKVVELRPEIDWNKGTTVRWVLDHTDEPYPQFPIYIGDDLTDEDAFDAVRTDGIGIAVRHSEDGDRTTTARFAVDSPDEVRELLERLANRLATNKRTPADAWTFTFDGYEPRTEKLREALCTVGNGYLATRGSAPESRPGPAHYPGTYAAGVFNRLDDELAGSTIDNESMVNLPNWLATTFRIEGGPWFDIDAVNLLSYQQSLDLRSAVLSRRFRFRDSAGRTTSVTQQRFVSMNLAHVCALRTVIVAEDWSGAIEIRSTLDASVRNSLVERYKDLSSDHLALLQAHELSSNAVLLEVETSQSRIRVALASRSTAWRGDDPQPATYRLFDTDGQIGHDITVDLSAGQSTTVEKVVTVCTGRDDATSDPATEAERRLSRLGRFSELQRGHLRAWEQLWERLSIEFDNRDDELRVLRLHMLHLVQTLSPNAAEIDVGVPARGLHGEAYRGHIFWDELFVFPVLNLRLPNVTRSLLGYRYRRLPEARAAATAAGCRGAMFPWQSGSDGREESPRLHLNPRSGRWNPDPSGRAHHVGLAVAYNVWQYYQVTGDRHYLIEYGAELLTDIARFWVSKATYDPSRRRYTIGGVIGPDEFHSGYPSAPYDGIDNNAYTNVMAVWVIIRAIEALDLLPLPNRLDLLDTLELPGSELAHWDDVTRRMFIPFHDGVISQFEGYDELAELDWDSYLRRYGRIQRLDRILEAENDDVNRYKVSKQADTLMLFYLLSSEELSELFHRLGYGFTPDQIPTTIEYYVARTSHGSTLSAVVHSWVLARGNRDRATEFFEQVLKSDVADIQGGTTSEGIHLAAMAGSIDLLQRCFTGLETRADRLVLAPSWPETLGVLAFPIHYRGHRLRLRISGTSVEVSADPGDNSPVDVECRGNVQRLSSGTTIRFPGDPGHNSSNRK